MNLIELSPKINILLEGNLFAIIMSLCTCYFVNYTLNNMVGQLLILKRVLDYLTVTPMPRRIVVIKHIILTINVIHMINTNILLWK